MLDLAQRGLSNSWSYGSNPPTDAQHFYSSQAKFTNVRFLGWGSFGQVHELRKSLTGKVYARKIIYPGNWGWGSEALEREVQAKFDTMKKLIHIHIVRVLISQKELDSFNILMLPEWRTKIFEPRSSGRYFFIGLRIPWNVHCLFWEVFKAVSGISKSAGQGGWPARLLGKSTESALLAIWFGSIPRWRFKESHSVACTPSDVQRSWKKPSSP